MAPPTTAEVATEVAEADPVLFVAVTVTVIALPNSALVKRYVDAVAPEIATPSAFH
jgi:hypothetical protein